MAVLRGSTPRSQQGRGRRSSGAAPSDPRGAKTAVGQQAPGTRGREPKTLQRRGPSEGTGGVTKEGIPHRGRVSQKRGPWVGGAAENGILGPAGSGDGGRHLRSFLFQMGRDWGWCAGIGFLLRADQEIGVFWNAAPHTRLPSPRAWRPDFPGAAREAP